MARAAPLLLLLACAACIPIPRSPEVKRDTDEAHVSALALAFPAEGEGLAKVELLIPGREDEAGEVGDLVWELWLEGRPFASGVVRPDLKLPVGQWAKAQLELPLLYRAWSWSPHPRSLRVRFKGRLVRRFGLDAPATFLDERRTVVADGAPLFDRGPTGR